MGTLEILFNIIKIFLLIIIVGGVITIDRKLDRRDDE